MLSDLLCNKIYIVYIQLQGADIDATDDKGATALDKSQEHGYPHIEVYEHKKRINTNIHTINT